MDIGALVFPTDKSMPPAELAVELEQRGYESVWVSEHTHIPTSRATPFPGGGELPQEFCRILDPLVALTAAATVTSRLRVGTGIMLAAQHDPISMAKRVATLDLLSAGRVIIGLGTGWNREEMSNHGVIPERRRSVLREHVLAMRALWTEEAASFEGEFVKFPPSWSWPKPVTVPHPPLVMGGAGGPVTFRHIAEYCDGWMPVHGTKDIDAKIRTLRGRFERAGRDPAKLSITIYRCPPDEATIESYAEMGVGRCLMGLPSVDEAQTLRVLQAQQSIVDRFGVSTIGAPA